jgi:AcrR family transcriptional regulator
MSKKASSGDRREPRARKPQTAKPQTRKPQQARSRATRAKILDTAVELVEKLGWERVSLADVAAQAGIGTGTVYHHFPDKRALLLDLLEELGERASADRRSDLQLEAVMGNDPRAALRGLLRRFYERLHDRSWLFAEISAHVYRDQELRDRCDRLRFAGVERFEAMIEFGQARGMFRATPDPAIAAFLMLHAIELLTAQVLQLQRPGSETERVLHEITEMFCRYLVDDE